MSRHALKRTIEAVIKVTERCNINCTYCYVFNKGDESYKLHDPYMKQDTVLALAKFLGQGAKDLNFERIFIDLHGGEPLMMKKHRFVTMCETFQEHAPEGCSVAFTVQTNAMLVDDEWLDIFQQFNFAVGVSLDGPQVLNDRERVDHRGRGTYQRTRAGLEKLRTAHVEGRLRGLGILTVANAEYDAREIFAHFVDEVGVDHIDFLLPIESHDTFDTAQALKYGQIFVDLYDEWVRRGDGAISIRTISNTIRFLQNGHGSATAARQARDGDHVIFTVSSSGDLGPDDSLRTVATETFASQSIHNSDVRSFLNSKEQQEFLRAENTLPDECVDCAWNSVCRGGAANGRLVNRFNSRRGFNNPSIFCAGLKLYYSHVAADLLKRGMSFERLKNSLLHNSAGLLEYNTACGFAAQTEALSNDAETVNLV